MNYVLDTNILIHILTGSEKGKIAVTTMEEEHVTSIISIVTKAELLSIAQKRRWGNKKVGTLKFLLDKLVVIPIKTDEIVRVYAEIDAYSQGKLIGKKLPGSARNMGKNDLWIAATAYLTKSTLMTTDNDFNHLESVYLELKNLNNSER